MTGRIKNLSAGSASGLIEGENGRRYHFDSWSVLVCDVTYLGVGQLVTFDLEAGSNPTQSTSVYSDYTHRPTPKGNERKRRFATWVSIRQWGFGPTGLSELPQVKRR